VTDTTTPVEQAGADGSYPTHLLDQDGQVVVKPTRQDVEQRVTDGKFFWLDLPEIGDDELGWLRDVFKLHPLAIDDAEHFGERPKLDEYDGYTVLVLFGTQANPVESASDDQSSSGNPVPPAPGCTSPQSTLDDLQKVSEVHCIVSEHWLLTLHQGTCPSLREYALRAINHKMPNLKQAQLVYRIADVLIDSFAPILGELDDRIDELQSAVIEKPTNEQLAEMLKYRAALIQLRRLITPQRDVFASLSAGVTELPGFDDDDVRYLRDVYDHLIHLSDLIDSYRDLLAGTTDAYLSVVSNQLNVVMKQLSIIATIFLPLSFLTGFFGQNFSWLVGGLNGVAKFFVLGLGTEVVAVAALYVVFKRQGWFSN
jgi:magnesium transporter